MKDQTPKMPDEHVGWKKYYVWRHELMTREEAEGLDPSLLEAVYLPLMKDEAK